MREGTKFRAGGGATLLLAAAVSLGAEIAVPNGSFESPVTVFVSTPIDVWQKTPKPAGYNEGGGFTWEQLTGVFKNTPPGRFDHIGNCDGAQALFVFAIPTAGLTQDTLPGPPGGDPVRYEVGKAYRLTVGVIGGGGGMPADAALQLGLHYRDATNGLATVAVTTVTNAPVLFPAMTNLVDFQVVTPRVQAGNPWVGQPIGVHLMAATEPPGTGGYWDVDNVRLREVEPPRLTSAHVVDGQIEFTIESEPAVNLVILTSNDPGRAASEWAQSGTATSGTGTTSFREPVVPGETRFYRVEQSP
jgi:hypothetical protein